MMSREIDWRAFAWGAAFWITVLATAAVALLAGAALAQSGPADPADPMAQVAALLAGAKGGQWLSVVPPAVYLLVWAVRKLAASLAGRVAPGSFGQRFLDFLGSRAGGYVLNGLGNAAGAFGVSFAAGVPGGMAGASAVLGFLINVALRTMHGDGADAIAIRGDKPPPPLGSVVNR